VPSTPRRANTIAAAWCSAITLASYLWARAAFNRDPTRQFRIDTRRAPADHGQLPISGTCVPQQLRNAGMGRRWARQVSPQPSGGLVVLVAQRGEVVHPGQAHDLPPRMLMTLGRLPVRALHLFGVAGAALQEQVPEARRRPRARGVPRSGQVLLPTDVLCPPAG
jgi:hypothetical protein